ncbi:hypothetical protein BGZ65_009190, partial [Modicella reniformis]
MTVGRALQGIGTGFTVPSAQAITTTIYLAGAERNTASSVFGGTAAVGSIIGVLLGGWRWMFYIAAIIGFILTVLSVVVIPAAKAQGKVEDRRLDYFGITSITF